VEGSLDEVVAVLENRGVKFGPVVQGAVRIAPFTNLDGTPLYLCEPPRGR
jgi:hypothetical protein